MVIEFISGFIGALVDPIFSPLLLLKPHIALFIFSSFVTSVVFGINKFMTRKGIAKEVKNRMTEVREKLAEAQKQGKKSDIQKFLSEYMKIHNEYMRQTLKIMIVTMFVVILVFPWAAYRFSTMQIMTLPFPLPFMGTNANWIFWYILVSLTTTWMLRKFIGD